MTRPLALAIGTGLVIGLLAWIDPLFLPLVLAGPPISGAVAAVRGIALRWVALAWAAGGISMLVGDWILNSEDRAFHGVLTLIMVALASAGWWVAARLARRRGTSLASGS
jgi:hypothetical protein